MWMPVSKDALDDAAEGLKQGLIEMRETLNYWGHMGGVPLTPDEERTGYRTFTGTDGKVRQFSEGWRAEQERREADARRESEMVACPYVACTCGHHEDA